MKVLSTLVLLRGLLRGPRLELVSLVWEPYLELLSGLLLDTWAEE